LGRKPANRGEKVGIAVVEGELLETGRGED